ncbi:MAG: hypothetical protein KGI33_12360 [Thaumarchaeota archaeon]|nr:hypothetical protein [Nitrososphaerota archaeon]
MKDIAVPTTTHSIKSPYRFWGKTIDILGVLSEFGGLTTKEISEKTGYNKKEVRHTCVRCFYRGVIEPIESWGWRLTPLGNTILYYTNNNNRGKIEVKQGKNRGKIGVKCFKQFKLSAWEDNCSEPERVVVDTIIAHWKKTGSRYVWLADLDPENLHIPPGDLDKAINKLRRDNILYAFRDPYSRLMKVGLKESFVSTLPYQ